MKPVIQPLAKWQRTLIFLFLLAAFLVSLPALMFYATGYRYDFFADKPTITATGGLYIAVDSPDGLIYVNEEEVTNARVFRKASYIQGLIPGIHRVHVQSPELHTWVKELPVFPHIVTEAEAFNLPLRPQVRPITEFSSIRGDNVIFATTTSQEVFSKASSTVTFITATGTATTSYLTNSEFSVLKLLFTEQEELIQAKKLAEKNKFYFSTTTKATTTMEVATTTKNQGNLSIYQKGEDVYVGILDKNNKIPYYFCAAASLPESLVINETINQDDEIFAETNLIQVDDLDTGEKCRLEIRLDRKWQEVIAFDFFPENTNLILLHLTDGIYVVEIDDRSWQNVQLLYPGMNLKMLIYGGSIFVKEKDFMFEVLTELPLE